jgi:hypothetical protein
LINRQSENIPAHIKPSVYTADKDIPAHYFAMAGSQMSLHTHLLTLCGRSIEKTWSAKRNVAGYKKNFKMPSMGRQRL